jgi:NADH-quinone oxidoreductase subunit L
MLVDWLARSIPLFPLAACLATFILGARVLRERSHWPAIAGCALAALASLTLLLLVGNAESFPQAERTISIYQWMRAGGPGVAAGQAAPVGDPALVVNIALRVDALSAVMLAMLTVVSTLVVVYASEYMRGDPGFWRFFAVVSLFVFSMIMLVLSANFVQLFVFWEAVGLCSYLLIGFWYQKPAAAAAGMKAFVVNRIGDFGLAAGIFLIWKTFASVEFTSVLDSGAIAAAMAGNPHVVTAICLCLFAGAVGKSAQFPLHVWLPDAMEGPTPVSALIHAATMVTAGVYLVARCTPLFAAAPDARLLVAIVGGFTALLAALMALTQTDLKRILAYSTVSQLGYMFLGLGTGLASGVAGAMFHLVTHAFFKALLFLGAGSVMHAMGGEIDLREFRGLRRLMPQTHATFLAGALALAGLPPLSGFWSKDAILSAVREAAHQPVVDQPTGRVAGVLTGHDSALQGAPAAPVYGALFWMAVATALLTSFYTFRAFFLTFYGPERIPRAAGHHAHESGRVMCVPLWILAAGAALLGLLLGHLTGLFDQNLSRVIPGLAAGGNHGVDWLVVGLSSAAALLGGVGAWALYARETELPARFASAAGPFYRLSLNRFYLDEAYGWLLVLPLTLLAYFCRFVDWLLIDGLLVGGASRIPALVGRMPRPIQNGLVQFYALAMSLGLAVLLWALISRQP